MSITFPKFIVFEGVDGTGKSTQVDMLSRALTSVGKKVFTLNAPSVNTPMGRLIRKQVLTTDGAYRNFSDDSVGLMMLASLRELAQHIIEEHTKNEFDYVICDRWWMSAVVYNQTKRPNGDASDLSDGWLCSMIFRGLFEQLGSNRMDSPGWDKLFFYPTVVFRMVMRVDDVLERLGVREVNDAYDSTNRADLEKRSNRYVQLFEENDIIEYWVEIDASKSPQEVHAGIMEILLKDNLIEATTSMTEEE